MFGGAPRAMVEQVTRYGEFAGVVFQLAEDVIDIRSDAATTGKTPGTDLREGVPTMPVLLLGRRVASPDATDADRDLLAAIDGDLSDDAVLADVVGRLAAHPVVDETAELARRWAYQAVGAVAALPEGDVKDSLAAFAEALVARAA